MLIKKRKWNYEPIDKILTEPQMELLNTWVEVNGLDKKTIEYQDDMLHGVTVRADHPVNHETWAIDFVRSRR